MIVRAGPVPEEALTEAEAARMCGLPVPQPSAEELLGDDALTDEAVSTQLQTIAWPVRVHHRLSSRLAVRLMSV